MLQPFEELLHVTLNKKESKRDKCEESTCLTSAAKEKKTTVNQYEELPHVTSHTSRKLLHVTSHNAEELPYVASRKQDCCGSLG